MPLISDFQNFSQNIVGITEKFLEPIKFFPPHSPCSEYQKKFSIHAYLKNNLDFNSNVLKDERVYLQEFFKGGGRWGGRLTIENFKLLQLLTLDG